MLEGPEVIRLILLFWCKLRGHRIMRRYDKFGRSYVKCLRCGTTWRR